MRKSIFPRLALASTLALAASSLWAHAPGDGGDTSLHSLVERSDAIVYGEVIDIVYRNSEPTENSPNGLPHTFVTYQLDKVLRGRIRSETLTLKIPGGADGQGGVYNVTTAPQFASGQVDVLFIGDEDENGCPLVECVDGRFRVEEERVYNGWGVPLVEAEKYLVFGGKPRFDLNVMEMPRPAFDEVLRRPEVIRMLKEKNISTDEELRKLRAEYEREAPSTYQIQLSVADEVINDDYTGEPEAEPIHKYAEPMLIDEFFALILKHVSHIDPPKNEVVSANPKDRFKVADPRLEKFTVSEDKTDISDEEARDLKQEGAEPDSIGPASVKPRSVPTAALPTTTLPTTTLSTSTLGSTAISLTK